MRWLIGSLSRDVVILTKKTLSRITNDTRKMVSLVGGRSFFYKILAFSLCFVLMLSFFGIAKGSPVDTGANPEGSATQWSQQRKLWEMSGLYWLFYADYESPIEINYRTSADGVTWSNDTLVVETDGGKFSGWFNGTYFHYVRLGKASDARFMYYRRGTPLSNGSITWTTDEQLILDLTAFASRMCFPFISVDSDGYPFISFGNYTGTYSYAIPRVLKSTLNNGTWETESGFPYLLSSNVSLWYTQIVPLTSGKMYAVYYSRVDRGGIGCHGRLWNGTSWGDDEEIDGTAYKSITFSSVTIDDDVHLVYPDETPNFCYVQRLNGSGWTSKTIIEDYVVDPYFYGVSLTKYGSDLYVFFEIANIGIRFKPRINGTWKQTINWISDPIVRPSTLNTMYERTTSKLGVAWISGTTNPPWTLYFEQFDYSVFVDPFTIWNDNQTFGILNASWSEQDRQLIFYTIDNVTIDLGSWIESPNTITDNDVFLSWTKSDLNITLSNLGGLKIVATWDIDLPSGSPHPSRPSEDDVEIDLPIAPPFRVNRLGLIIVVGGVGVFGISALYAKLKRPSRRKPRGVQHRAPTRKTPRPRKPRAKAPRKRRRDARGRFLKS